MKTYRVVYSDKAKFSLQQIHAYLQLTASPKVANEVKATLYKRAQSLSTNPKRFPIDQRFSSKNLEVRSLTQWNYRIVYSIFEQDVLILRFYGAGQDPVIYDLE